MVKKAKATRTTDTRNLVKKVEDNTNIEKNEKETPNHDIYLLKYIYIDLLILIGLNNKLLIKLFRLCYFRGKSRFENYLVFLLVYRYFKKIGNTDHILASILKGLSHEST